MSEEREGQRPGSSLTSQGITAGFLGLHLMTLWVCAEALYHWHFEGASLEVRFGKDSLGPVLVFALGVSAPLTLMVAGGAVWARVGWSRVSSRTPLAGKFWAFWAPTDPEVSAENTAKLLTGLAALVGVAAVTILAGPRITLSIRTPALAYLMLFLMQSAALVAAVAFAPTLLLPARAVFLRIARNNASWVRRFAQPWVFLASLGGGAVALAIGVVASRTEATFLPWEWLVCPSFAVLLTTLVGLKLTRRTGRAKMWGLGVGSALLLGLQVWTGLLAANIPSTQRAQLNDVMALGGIVDVWFSGWGSAVDFDGDGMSSLYGGSDCAPFNADIHPRQVEIPNNGIDEDCSGRDLVDTSLVIERGPVRYRRPNTMAPMPNIILVTTDALGFDHTGLGGYARDVTPGLDRWAQRATTFETAFTISSSTDTSLPSLMTGSYPSDLPVDLENNAPRPPPFQVNLPTLAQMLNNVGYETLAIPGDSYFENWEGIAHGFERYELGPVHQAKARGESRKVHTAPEITAFALKELAAPRERPLFLWIHYYDHHPFYVVPDGEVPLGGGQTEVDIYDTELRFADRHWSQLFEAVEQRWDADQYLLIFTSDHGEAFDVNHAQGHHHDQSLRTRELQVPLIIQGPAQRGQRIKGLASSLDIVPTVANLVSLCSSLPWRGESLVGPLFDGSPVRKTGLFSFFFLPNEIRLGDEPLQQIGLRTDELYYYSSYETDESWLVQWRDDPLEQQDLSSKLPNEVDALRYLSNRTLLELDIWRAVD